ncbi:MAG: hypothetical protein ABIC91_03380 [Nanoarchaeota archaeon]|nr:hypothetical protein [Nanoarchaeota archaeon]MBU1030033.1 hypothetical protein [Nanoarchaeota archaeon]MBU1849959.1 hypothetical protein [Nanoarchaeota archaeon]
MPITSYYDKDTLEQYTTVNDEYLNKLLQEVRQKFDNEYFLEERNVIRKKLFRKPEKQTLYTLLINLEKDYKTITECQIVNFCEDGNGSINTAVPKSYIHTLFCGLLNGYNHKNQDEK